MADHKFPLGTDGSGVTNSEEELKYNLRQQELLAEIALDLNDYQEFDESIQQVLQALLEHTGVSRIYIFEDIDNGLACSNTYEVCNQGIEPQIQNLSYLPYEIVPYWVNTLRDVGYIFSENIAELPADVREILEPQEIKSILVLPLIVNGAAFGFIGFDECVVHKQWKRSDLQLLRAISGIISNAFEREITYKNLIAKNEELNKTNAELDNFVYSISHDLRSPLLSVKGILNLVFRTSNLDEKTKGLLLTAENSVNRLDETIREILDYSRNTRLGITYEEFDFAALVNDIHNDLRYSVTANLDFRAVIAEDCKKTHSDKSRINTILKNLLGNAFKYIRKGEGNPWVELTVMKQGTELVFQVQDNGEGISEQHLSKVFDMFYRASTTSQGSGLGLYICKEVLQKMNGSISLDSIKEQGTTVTVRIPIHTS